MPNGCFHKSRLLGSMLVFWSVTLSFVPALAFLLNQLGTTKTASFGSSEAVIFSTGHSQQIVAQRGPSVNFVVWATGPKASLLAMFEAQWFMNSWLVRFPRKSWPTISIINYAFRWPISGCEQLPMYWSYMLNIATLSDTSNRPHNDVGYLFRSACSMWALSMGP